MTTVIARAPRCGRIVASRLLPVAALLASLGGPAWAAPKTDVVELVNGDRVTGEIKALEHNQLRLSTSHMGTIYIEWDKVARVRSTQNLLLERTDGTRAYGQVREGSDAGQLLVEPGAGRPAESLPAVTVVRITPIDGGDFVDRLDGYVNVGFGLAKANDQRNLDVGGGLSSRNRKREWAVDASASVMTDDGNATSDRYDLQAYEKRFLGPRNFYLGGGRLTRNSELDLNLRTLAGGAFGRYLLQTSHAEWSIQGGLAWSNEHYTGAEQFDSLEALVTTDFSIFRYDFPDTDVGGTLTLLPSLTKSGRYRAETELHASYEFVEDLFFKLSLYGSYDSEPPLTGAASSDYGITTSLGYTF